MKTIHGTAVVLDTRGVLLTGEAGAGKSSLARALVEAVMRDNQFARWVADDRLAPRTGSGGALVVSAPKEILGIAEHGHLGILGVEYVRSARIDLICELTDKQNLERMPDEQFHNLWPQIPLINVPKRSLEVSVPLILNKLMRH